MLSTTMLDRLRLANVSDGKDSPFITMDRRVWLEYINQVRVLERELCTCPWPADAMKSRHLLSCRLLRMEHEQVARQLA